MTVLHIYRPIGDGEFSRNRFRPLCSSTGEPIFIPESERGLTEDRSIPFGFTACETCVEVRTLLDGAS